MKLASRVPLAPGVPVSNDNPACRFALAERPDTRNANRNAEEGGSGQLAISLLFEL